MIWRHILRTTSDRDIRQTASGTRGSYSLNSPLRRIHARMSQNAELCARPLHPDLTFEPFAIRAASGGGSFLPAQAGRTPVRRQPPRWEGGSRPDCESYVDPFSPAVSFVKTSAR